MRVRGLGEESAHFYVTYVACCLTSCLLSYLFTRQSSCNSLPTAAVLQMRSYVPWYVPQGAADHFQVSSLLCCWIENRDPDRKPCARTINIVLTLNCITRCCDLDVEVPDSIDCWFESQLRRQPLLLTFRVDSYNFDCYMRKPATI